MLASGACIASVRILLVPAQNVLMSHSTGLDSRELIFRDDHLHDSRVLQGTCHQPQRSCYAFSCQVLTAYVCEDISQQLTNCCHCRAGGLGVGVADGVYMWKQQGIDSGLFSRSLMRYAKQALKDGVTNPVKGAWPSLSKDLWLSAHLHSAISAAFLAVSSSLTWSGGAAASNSNGAICGTSCLSCYSCWTIVA